MTIRTTLRLSETTATGVLAVDLKDILRAIQDVACEMYWAVLDLEATGTIEGWTLPDYEAYVRDSPVGVQMSWQEFERLSSCLDQTIEGLFCGSTERSALPARSDPLGIMACDVVLEAVDSGYWLVSTSSAQIADRVRKYFKVEEMDGPEGMLQTIR